jgi:hypothetical protein
MASRRVGGKSSGGFRPLAGGEQNVDEGVVVAHEGRDAESEVPANNERKRRYQAAIPTRDVDSRLGVFGTVTKPCSNPAVE